MQLASDSEGEEEEDEDGEGQEADDTQIEITKAFDMELPILKMCNKVGRGRVSEAENQLL